jgi:chromosome segregation ATPase
MEDMVKDLGKMAIDEGLKSLPGGAIISKFVTGGNDAAPKDNSSKILEKLLDAEVKNIKELISVGNNLAETKYTVSGIQTTLNSTKETLEKQISQNYNNLNQRTEQLAEKTFSTIQNLGSSLTDSLDQTNQKFHRDLNTQAETLSRSWESKIKENSKKFEENLNEVKKAGAEALINKSKEVNNKVSEIQKSFNQNLKKVHDDFNEKNKELYQRLSRDISDVSKNGKQLESMFKEGLNETQKEMNDLKKENENLFDDVKDKVKELTEKAAESKADYNNFALTVSNLTAQINIINKTLIANNQKIQTCEKKCESLGVNFQEQLDKALEKEVEKHQKKLDAIKKETIEVQNKINKDILKISKEAFQNSASLNDVKIYDLPKLYDDIYKIQNKICEEENIKKMTQNRAESRITELERKLQTLNEKYMALLEDNIKIQSELHEISLQQITAPTNFAPNFYRQRQNSEDEYSEIDNINEEFTNAE